MHHLMLHQDFIVSGYEEDVFCLNAEGSVGAAVCSAAWSTELCRFIFLLEVAVSVFIHRHDFQTNGSAQSSRPRAPTSRSDGCNISSGRDLRVLFSLCVFTWMWIHKTNAFISASRFVLNVLSDVVLSLVFLSSDVRTWLSTCLLPFQFSPSSSSCSPWPSSWGPASATRAFCRGRCQRRPTSSRWKSVS